jgi:SOS-response transcriptional repressor LexA
MVKLTQRQAEILEFYLAYTLDNLAQPEIRHICAVFEIASTNAIVDHFRALQRKGYFKNHGKRCSRGDIGITTNALRFAIANMTNYKEVAEVLLKKWTMNPDFRIDW